MPIEVPKIVLPAPLRQARNEAERNNVLLRFTRETESAFKGLVDSHGNLISSINTLEEDVASLRETVEALPAGGTGAAGPPGPPGAQGPPGADGADGADSADGADGTPAASEIRYSDGRAVEFFDDYAAGSISTFDKGLGFDTNGVGTGCTIVSKTMVSGQVHNRLAINQGQYGRKLPWGNDWGRIQIAMMLRINRGSTFSGGASYFGVCSGTMNMVASSSTDNFAGVKTGQNSNDFTYTTGTRMNYFDHNPTFRFVTRRGTTNTDRTSGSGSAGRAISADEGYISLHFLEISRPAFASAGSSITYTFGRSLVSGTMVEHSSAKTVLMDVLHQETLSTVGAGSMVALLTGAANNTTSYSFDESTGELDTFNVSWVETFDLEIAALGIRKVY